MEKMLSAKLLRLARRVERIRKQEQPGNFLPRILRGFLGKLGAEHTGLASAIGVAAEENWTTA